MSDFSSIRSFNQLYKDYKRRFVRFAFSYVRDLALAEDIVMDALLIYWENKDKLEPNSNVPAYILTIIKNKSLNHLQHLKTKNQTFDKFKEHAKWELDLRIASLQECNPDDLLSEEVQKIVRKTLSELPKQTVEIYLLSRSFNHSHKEISEKLGITTKGVEYHISRALKALRVNLKDYLHLIIFY